MTQYHTTKRSVPKICQANSPFNVALKLKQNENVLNECERIESKMKILLHKTQKKIQKPMIMGVLET